MILLDILLYELKNGGVNRKKIYKFIGAICLVSLVFMSSVNAVERRYVPCPMGGKHQTEIVARAIMREVTYQNPGAVITSGGKYYKCKQCGLGVVTQYSPVVARCLGTYIFDSAHYTGSDVIVSYGVDGYEWDYPKGYMWDGMDWLD